MKLIINADDFGMTEGVTTGIFSAIRKKAVTSTTMMMNANDTLMAADLAKKNPELALGLHLNISIGFPLTMCPSLIDTNGRFMKPNIIGSDNRYDTEEIYREYLRQYDLFISLVGREPTHLDSHLYLHQRFPKAKQQILRLAKEKRLPVREYDSAYFPGITFIDKFKVTENDTLETMIFKFKNLICDHQDEEWLELMVHPAFCDDLLLASSSYNKQRNLEYETLVTEDIADFLEQKGIHKASFRDLTREVTHGDNRT